jgi:ERCC4-type nuclease
MDEKKVNFKIIIDHREQHENSIEHNIIAKFDELKIEYEMRQLPVGDYLVVNKDTGDTFCIERKIINDFCGSVIDGRLKEEIAKMNEIYAKNFLIIVGHWDDYYSNRVKLKKMNIVKNVTAFTVAQRLGVFASVSARTNTKILQVENDHQFIDLLLTLGNKLTDGKLYDVPLFKRKKTEDNVFLNMLISFPNVSEEKANKIVDKYKTFTTFYNALKDDVFEVEGFGKKTIDLMKKVIVNAMD